MDNYTMNDYIEMVRDYVLAAYGDEFPMDDYCGRESYADCLEEQMYDYDGKLSWGVGEKEIFDKPRNELEKKIVEQKSIEKVIGQWPNEKLRMAIEIVVGNNVLEDDEGVLYWVDSRSTDHVWKNRWIN